MRIGIAALLGLSAILSGCAATGKSDEASIQFALTDGAEPADCHRALADLGSSHLTAHLRDARFYVSEVRLIDASGQEVPVQLNRNDWQYAGVALLDFEDGTGLCKGGTAAANSQITGTVPAGQYTGLAFTVGVPVAGTDEQGRAIQLNHSSTETSPAPLDLAAMAWSWQAGRKFMKIEVNPEGGIRLPSGEVAHTWFVHLGSTGCVGNPAGNETVTCTRSNRIPVRFSGFDPRTQQVVLDLRQLFLTSDLGRDLGGAVGCMSGPDDPECGPVFTQLGLNLTDSAPGAGDAGQPRFADGRSAVFRISAKP